MEKDFDRWNEKKKEIHAVGFADFVNEREVWWCRIGVNVGVEADGKHGNFERPVLILKKFNKESALIVPLTLRVKDNPYHIVGEHNNEKFAAIISQIKLVSTNRLRRLIYRMDSAVFERIHKAVLEMITQNRPPLARGPRRPHGHN